MLHELRRELNHALKEPALRWLVLIAFSLSTIALLIGALTISHQKDMVLRLEAAVTAEQLLTIKDKTDPGDIAYNLFHLTFDPPTDLAFIALGQRNERPWLHRLRMLALEGQIHETNDSNPEILILGQLDFTFFLSVLVPLIIISLLFDIEGRERREGRYELICAASPLGSRVFHIRAAVRSLLLSAAIILPLIAAAISNDLTILAFLSVLGLIFFQIVLWVIFCRIVTYIIPEAVTAALSLVTLWLLFTVLTPIIGKTAVENSLPVPNGGTILLTQRETVNAAWDLPKETTMDAFIHIYPEWKAQATIHRPFEWKWYYAFQEMGDQAAQPKSWALYQGMTDRHEAMALVALLSPALFIERAMTELAGTDVLQHLRYVQCARAFHADLRHFYYPYLFNEKAMSENDLAQLPEFEPCAI